MEAALRQEENLLEDIPAESEDTLIETEMPEEGIVDSESDLAKKLTEIKDKLLPESDLELQAEYDRIQKMVHRLLNESLDVKLRKDLTEHSKEIAALRERLETLGQELEGIKPEDISPEMPDIEIPITEEELFEREIGSPRLIDARSKFVKLLQERESLKGKIFSSKEKEEEYEAAWKEYAEAQKEELDKQKEMGANLRKFLARESEEIRGTLTEKYKVKENWLIRGYKKLGEMNLYNYLEKIKKQVEEMTANGQEVSGWKKFWSKRAEELENSSSIFKAGAKFLSVRTAVSVALADLSFIDVFATNKLAIGGRTAMAAVGGTVGSRGGMDMIHETLRRKQLGYEGDIFESEEEAREAWSERLGVDVNDSGKKMKKVEKKVKKALILDGTPAENLQRIEEVISDIEAHAIVNKTDLQKDAYYQKLLATREAAQEKVFGGIVGSEAEGANDPEVVYDLAAQMEAQKQGFEMTAKNVKGQKLKRDFKRVASVALGAALGFFRAGQMIRKAALLESQSVARESAKAMKAVEIGAGVAASESIDSSTELPGMYIGEDENEAAAFQRLVDGLEGDEEAKKVFAGAMEGKVQPSEFLDDTLVTEKAGHNSITGLVARQLQTRAAEFGYDGDPEDAKAVKTWAKKTAAKLALDQGYINEDGSSTGLKYEEGKDSFVVLGKDASGEMKISVLSEKIENLKTVKDIASEPLPAAEVPEARVVGHIVEEIPATYERDVPGFVATVKEADIGNDELVVNGKRLHPILRGAQYKLEDGAQADSVYKYFEDDDGKKYTGLIDREGKVRLIDMEAYDEGELVGGPNVIEKPTVVENSNVENAVVETKVSASDAAVAGYSAEATGSANIGTPVEGAPGPIGVATLDSDFTAHTSTETIGDHTVTTEAAAVSGRAIGYSGSEMQRAFLANEKFVAQNSDYGGHLSQSLRTETFGTDLRGLAVSYNKYIESHDPALKASIKRSMELMAKNAHKTPGEFFNKQMLQEFGFEGSSTSHVEVGPSASAPVAAEFTESASETADAQPEAPTESPKDIVSRHVDSSSNVTTSTENSENGTVTTTEVETKGTLVGMSHEKLAKAFLAKEDYLPKGDSNLKRVAFDARLRPLAVSYNELQKTNNPFLKNSVRQTMLSIARLEGKKPGELFNAKICKEFDFEMPKPKTEKGFFASIIDSFTGDTEKDEK